MSSILICYARADRAVAARVRSSLRDLGVDAFWDEDMPGADWSAELYRQIDQIAGFLVVWSRASIDSRWVRDEARIALGADKLVSVGWGAPAPFPFERQLTIRLEGWTGALPHPGWTQVIAAVDVLIARQGGRPGEVSSRLAARDAAVETKQREAVDAEGSLLRARKAAADAAEQAQRRSESAADAQSQVEQNMTLRGSPTILKAARAKLAQTERARDEAQDAVRAAAAAVEAAERRFEAAMEAFATQLGTPSLELAPKAPATTVERLAAPPPKPKVPLAAARQSPGDASSSRIAISYRRADTREVTERIVDRLLARYGEGAVFIDVESIPVGRRFRDCIDEALAASNVFLAMIGTRWIGRRRNAPPRIMEPEDLVRIEVETALSYGLPIIPVLIDGGRLPPATALPPSIQDLRRYNATPVETGRDFNIHVARLFKAIDDLVVHQPVRVGPR